MTRVLIDSGLHTLIPHADDLVEWLFAVLERGVSGRSYNVGSPEAISIRDLAVLVYSVIKTADGRIDMTVETASRIFILEFKLDDTAANALQQIKDRKYAEPYATSPKGVALLGVGFSAEQRTITDTADEVLR